MNAETLKRLLQYNPETGLFVWRIRQGKKMAPGTAAGTPHTRGYLRITIGYKRYYAHRLAWLYVHGDIPTDRHIDHIDGNTTNNRIANLRLATRSENLGNARRHKDSTSGLKGVSWHSQNKKWIANIQKDGKPHFLGCYETADDAHAAYMAAARNLYQAFARAE